MRAGAWRIALIGLLAAAGCAGCNPGRDAPDEPAAAAARRPVVVTNVGRISLERSALLPGVVEAWEDRLLSAVNAGRVEQIRAEEGQWVEKGHRIAAIDEATLRAQVNLAEARLRLSERELERARQLHDDGAVSPETLDRAEADRDVGRAQLDAARAQYDNAIVTAPVAGYVDELPVDEGEYVSPGDPIVHLVDDRRLKVVVAAPEREVHAVHEGDVALVTPTVEPRQWTGTVTHVAAAADPATRTFRVTIELDLTPSANDGSDASGGESSGTKGRLRPGTIVRVRLPLGRLDDVVAVPLAALVDRDEMSGVMIWNGGKAVWRPVRLGVWSGAWIQVESGLEPGDRLIVEGHRDVAEGEPVQVVETRSWDDILAAEPAG